MLSAAFAIFELSCLLILRCIYLEGTGYFDKRSDFEKSKYYNDETLENTCRKTFFKILFLGKEFGGSLRRYRYKYHPADYSSSWTSYMESISET